RDLIVTGVQTCALPISYGGITCFEFLPDDGVHAKPLKISEEALLELEDNLLLFFTGYSRTASKILQEQHDKSAQSDEAMLENLRSEERRVGKECRCRMW